ELFRKEILDNLSSRYIGKVVISTPITFKVLVLIFAIIGVMILTFIFMGSYTKKVRVMGQILPENGLVKIYSSQQGVVDRIFVKENDKVKKDDNLIEVKNSAFSKNNNTYESILSESELRKQLLKVEIEKTKIIHKDTIRSLEHDIFRLNKEIRNTNDLIINTQNKLKSAYNSYERYKALSKLHAVSLEDLDSKSNAYIDLENQIKALNSDLIKLTGELKSKESEKEIVNNQQINIISQLMRQLSSIEQERIQNQINTSRFIKSPVDGTISIINVEVGQTTDINKTVITISPSNEMVICNLFIPSNAIGFIKKGSEVSIRYQAYPYQKFGIAKGIVQSVSSSPIPSSDINSLGIIPMDSILNNEPIYLVKVKLEKQTIAVYGENIPLKSGMLLEADIKLDTR
ncbi:TPA: HlyD family secretion protein, partial [Acinetobacter baumannii]